eukprot:1113058_1
MNLPPNIINLLIAIRGMGHSIWHCICIVPWIAHRIHDDNNSKSKSKNKKYCDSVSSCLSGSSHWIIRKHTSNFSAAAISGNLSSEAVVFGVANALNDAANQGISQPN